MSSDASFNRFNGYDGLGNPIYSDIKIETKVGHAIGLGLGRRHNFEGELHFSYASVGYDSASAADGSFAASVPVSGEPSFFKLVPELAMACLSAIQAGSELRGDSDTAKGVIFFLLAHPWESHSATVKVLLPMIFFSAWVMKSNGV